ncbi:formate/nitrite transporter family protein [uncultured Succinatimonas sp.]|uniref:formate/nitrite transporter family protein n=1 Tax=uncultured Succinatimonas sp. TaxID=1262973 RepID=UPI0025DAEA48|nr:formate/nitrite transporter family protein [uncultured Succinatimonas sp.]
MAKLLTRGLIKAMITSQPLSFIVKSILAGMLIGCGCLAYVVIENKYIGSFLFSLGLLTIIIKEYNLYTGKVSNWIPKDTLKLLVMFLLNAFGTALVAYLFTFTRANIDAIHPLVEAKINDNLLSVFILACGCGAMMHIACFNFAAKNHPLYVIMPIMFFILCGFEHCVANAGFFAMAKTPVTLDLIAKTAVTVIGNAIGSLIFARLIPAPSIK